LKPTEKFGKRYTIGQLQENTNSKLRCYRPIGYRLTIWRLTSDHSRYWPVSKTGGKETYSKFTVTTELPTIGIHARTGY